MVTLPPITRVSIEEVEQKVKDPSDHHVVAVLKTGRCGGGHRYSLFGEHPYLIFRSFGQSCCVESGRGTTCWQEDPLSALRKIIAHFSSSLLSLPALPRVKDALPFSGGAIGAFSYDFKKNLNSSGMKRFEKGEVPDSFWIFFRCLTVVDELEERSWRIQIEGDEAPLGRGSFPASVAVSTCSEVTTPQAFTSSFSRTDYLSAVHQVIDYIRAGDIYQANIAQCFERPFDGSPFFVFKQLCDLNPAPMMAYVALPEMTMISSSPERLLKRRGNVIETSPIKGTRPRGNTQALDEEEKKALWSSEKENAELAMIIDLMRNDLGRCALPGKVKVTDPRRIESYANVHHLVATVSAEIFPSLDVFDIIMPCFPGGSITGCPKERAQEIINEIEPRPRGFYTGSLGYIDFNGDFDLNILIRTGMVTPGKISLHLGSGIVADSDPQQEYEEIMAKGESLFLALQGNP